MVTGGHHGVSAVPMVAGGPQGDRKTPTVNRRVSMVAGGPQGDRSVPTVTGGPQGDRKVPMIAGGPRGDRNVPTVTGRSPWCQEGPSDSRRTSG